MLDSGHPAFILSNRLSCPFYLQKQSCTHIFKKILFALFLFLDLNSLEVTILFENSKKEIVEGFGSGLPGGLHLIFWRCRMEGNVGFWGFIDRKYAPSAISKMDVVKGLGPMWGDNTVSVISK